MTYEPRFQVTASILENVMGISEEVARAVFERVEGTLPHLRRINRLKSLHSSLAIEGNSLSLDEVTAIIEGKKVIGPQNEITEVRNAYEAYEMLDDLDPFDVDHLLKAHAVMMRGLVDNPGTFRSGDEGVFDSEGNCIHFAPRPNVVPGYMKGLLDWTRTSDYPMIIKSCVFHYEFEYIHPFEDGNGRMGRLWQILLLSKYNELFKWIPVESMIRRYQNDYYEAIEYSNTQSDCTAFIAFMTEIILKALKESAATSVREDVGGSIHLTTNETALYALIRDGMFVDIKQAARLIGISVPTLNRCLRCLREMGLIRKEGNKKSGTWVIVKTGGSMAL